MVNIISSNVSKKRLINTYLDVVNVSLQLRGRERDVLALLIDIDLHWNPSIEKNVIDTTSRKYVMKETLMNKTNLTRAIYNLKKSNVLIPNGDGWVVNPKVIPVIENDKINIHFILDGTQEGQTT